MNDLVRIAAEVVVFDLDDTLYLERDFARSGFIAASRQFAGQFNPERFSACCLQLLKAGQRGDVFDRALEIMGVTPPVGLIEGLVEAYRSHRPKITLCRDAERFLARTVVTATGLISDGPAPTQTAKVAALGLADRIDHIVLTGAFPAGYGKPHPRAFEHIEEVTGFSGSALAYIADNAAKDFIAPNRRGWQTVQILRPGRIHRGAPISSDHAAGYVVTSLDQIMVGTKAHGIDAARGVMVHAGPKER